MARLIWITATALFICAAPGAYAQTLSGNLSGSASVTSGSGAAPLVNFGGYALGSPFNLSLSVGATTAPETYVGVGPTSGTGTVVGTVTINFNALTFGGSTVKSVSVATSGGNAASVSGGNVTATAGYELFWSNSTDCIVFNGLSCAATGSTTTIGETLAVTFNNNAVVDINLYNWSDWTMTPSISFTEVSGATTGGGGTKAPEPASIAMFGAGALGLLAVRNRRKNRA